MKCSKYLTHKLGMMNYSAWVHLNTCIYVICSFIFHYSRLKLRACLNIALVSKYFSVILSFLLITVSRKQATNLYEHLASVAMSLTTQNLSSGKK